MHPTNKKFNFRRIGKDRRKVKVAKFYTSVREKKPIFEAICNRDEVLTLLQKLSTKYYLSNDETTVYLMKIGRHNTFMRLIIYAGVRQFVDGSYGIDNIMNFVFFNEYLRYIVLV